MKRVLFLVPHLSTGGMPQYTYDLMRKIKDDVDVYCVEYGFISPHFVVQRNRIIELLGDRFFCLSDDKNELFQILNKIQPDVIHLQEVPEYFLDGDIATKLYSPDRDYVIVETSHDSSFPSSHKRFFPDHFALISQYQKNEFSKLGIPIDFIEADIEYKERQDRTEGLKKLGLDPNLKHVVNVGLFTPRKNQAEAIEYARALEGQPIQFHFVGNQADNFISYWQPLLQNLPSNIKIWGERSDVDDFYSCMDMMLFTSRGTGNDKETSPLVIRESIGYNLPALIFNLPVYLGMYDKYETITYMDFENKETNIELIKQVLRINQVSETTNVFHTLDGIVNFDSVQFKDSMYETIQTSGDAAGMWWGTFLHRELERGDVNIQSGDVFVDLGANIGISSHYAAKHGASKIYCFEPDPIALELLNKNIKVNHQSFNYAVSNKRENIELFHWPYNPVNVGPTYTVQTITLDDVFQMVDQPVIDYLKMDIEGFEEGVFDGVSKNVLRRIRKIFIEHHYPQNTDDFVKKLQNLGFDVYVEYGAGQNYLYCVNSNLKNYSKDLVNVNYDPTSNTIHYTPAREVKNIMVSIKDIDSQTVVWSSKYDSIPDGITYWMMPIPKGFYDFESESNFGGFTFDLYENGQLVFSKSHRIKKTPINKVITQIVNDSEPTFINYNEFFVQKIYNKYLEGNKYNTVIDVGANVGLWSEYVRSIADVNKVYMVEPNTVALDILHNSFDGNDDTVIVDSAMSDIDGKLEFFVNQDNSTVSSMVKEHKHGAGGSLDTTYFVNSVRFDTLIKQENIENVNLMKVDIEGAEYDLFNSMSEQDFAKVDNILSEYHLNDNRTLERDVEGLIKRFESFGFTCKLNVMHSTGGFIFATKSKSVNGKIKAVQFLLNGDYPKQEQSVQNLSVLEDYGIGYERHYNNVYTDLPPASKSSRPYDVSMELKPNALTPAHYGCYDSFRTAVLSEFDSDLDYFLVFEGDANIQDHEVFMSKLHEAIGLIDKHNLDYVSFGGIYDLEFGVLQSRVVEEMTEDFFVCDKIIGCQCLLFPQKSRKKIKEILRTEPWDALDIYLNNVSAKHGLRVGVSRKTFVTQYDGISTIDSVVKQFKEFSI
jgi:FkbM family methyltransferase